MEDEIEIPKYFICPISLQIMKDPVTTVTGMTYDRSSIERWLFHGSNTSCPVTKQPLTKNSDLTPNHTLRRLIQAWCTANADNGVDRIPTPKTPPEKTHFIKLLQDIWVPQLQLESLKKLQILATESERNRRRMGEAGVEKAMVWLVTECFKKDDLEVVEEALNVLYLVQAPLESMKLLIVENYDFIDAVTWVLQQESGRLNTAKIHAVLVLKPVIETSTSHFLGRLNVKFFQGLVKFLRDGISPKGTKAALRIMLEACPWGRNRMKIIEAGAVFELIEFQLATTDKRINELVLCILDHLCASADGRAQLLGHAAGLPLISKRILRISPAADDRAVRILSSICKFSATNEVLGEMLAVGAVTKLCLLLQAGCSANVKEKAMGVLKLHSKAWKNSPCSASVYLLTRQLGI
ncbi:hypothetical protein AAC387_Pa12g0903 [Persea americana]